ncbi:MAG: autotransporter-associated beta strand repeat-containing protein, partial [Planctomycetota bacterium]|nr:autotransporter-associated beta strand repeat-containing protein [Planctomycetota bacterium]
MRLLGLLVAATLGLVLVTPAQAVSYTWDNGGTGFWDTTDTNWGGSGSLTPWDSTNGIGNTATFNTAGATATVSDTVYTTGITFGDTATISGGTINLAGTTPTITATNNGAISSVLDGTAGLTKSGNGTLTLSGANIFSGVTTISAGALRISDASGLGTTTEGTTVSATSGAALQLNGAGITYNSEPLTINGTGISTGGALQNVSGSNTWAGAIALASAAAIGSDSGTMTITGGISGAFPLTFAGAGNTTISTNALNANITTITKIGSGTLTFDVASSLVTAPISVNNGTFTLSGAAVLGNVSGTISMATLQANRTDQKLTSATLPAGFQVGSFVLGQMVQRISTGVDFNISGGPNTTTTGLVPYTSGVQALGGGALVIDNSGTNVNNRFGGRAVGLGASTLSLIPSNLDTGTGTVTESVSALVLMMGHSVVTLTADTLTDATPLTENPTNFTAGLLNSRFVGNTALIRGTNLGSPAGNGVSTLTLTAAPTFIGITTALGTPIGQGILPWVIVDGSATGLGTSFATRNSGATQILRPLLAGEMSAGSAYTDASNVLLSGAQTALTANKTINSLTIDSGDVTITNPAFPAARPVLTITSGGLLSKTAASSISGGVLSWGNGQLDVFTPGANAAANVLTVSSRVSGQGLVKAGAGTLVLSSTSPAYPTFSQNAITGGLGVHNGSVYVNEGTVQLNAHNAIGSGVASGNTNDGNLLNVAYGGTLDLNGKTQFVGPVTSQLFLQNTGENLLDVRGGTITSSAPASLVAYVGNPGGGNPGPFSFGGSITGAVGFAVGGESLWAQQLTGANSYTGPTLVYQKATGTSFAAGLILKDGGTLYSGALTGSSRIDINFGGSLALDNTGLSNNTNRVNDAVDIGMNGGTLLFFGRAQTNSTETLGAVTAAQGFSTITVTPGGTGVNSADLTFTSLGRTASSGGTVYFVAGSGTLGASGNNPHIIIKDATPASLNTAGVMVNDVFPGALTNGGLDFASYSTYTSVNGVTSGGIGAMGATGYPAYYTADNPTNVNAPTRNYSTNGFTITGNVNINSLKMWNYQNVAFTTGTEILNLTSGNLLVQGAVSNTIGATVDSGRITAGDTAGAGTTSNLYLFTQNNAYVLNSRIVDNPNGARVRLVYNGSVTILNTNNSYTGGTVVNNAWTLGASSGVLIPNATTPADGLVLNGASVTLNNSPGQIGSDNIVTLNGNSNLNLFGNNTLAGLVINHIGQTAPVVNTTPSAFNAATNSTDITLTLTGGITSTTNNIRGVAQINGRVSLPSGSTLNIGAATFNGLVINPIQADLIVTGLAGGGGTITKSGDGVLQFNAATVFSGTLDVTAGGIQVASVANAGARFAEVLLENGAWLNLAGQDALFGSLSTPAAPATGLVTNSGGLKTLTVGFTGASTIFAGSFQRFNDATINLINLQTIGTGTMTLTGNTSTASGTMTLNSTSGGGVAFKDNGINNFLSGTVTVNAGSTLTLDNSGTANVNNRLANVATNLGLTLNGGAFTYIGRNDTASSENTGTGNLTLGSGESTITANEGTGGSGTGTSLVTFNTLTQNAGSTATFAGANLATATDKIIFTSAPGLTNNILPRLAVGTDFATYNQNGAGVANTNGIQAVSAYSAATNINTAATTDTLKTSTTTTLKLTAARTINAININTNSATLDADGSLLPTAGLTVSSGGVLVNGTGATISTPVLALSAEGIFRVNGSNTLDVNSRITGTAGLTKTGAGDMTLSKPQEYTGTTTVNQGNLTFASGLGNNPLLVTLGAATKWSGPGAATLNVNGGTLDLNGNSQVVGVIQSSNVLAGGGGTITSSAGGTAATLSSFGASGGFGGRITGNLNLTLNGNSNGYNSVIQTLTDQQSYTGATIIRDGQLTLKNNGALYSGLSGGQLANASVTLNYSTILFDNSGLNPEATPPTRIPATVPITMQAGNIQVTPAASADNVTSLGTVTIDRALNTISNGSTAGATLANGSGATTTLTVDNLANSTNGGVVNLYLYSNQYGVYPNSKAQRLFINNVNGTAVTAGTMLPAWVGIGTSGGNTTGLQDFATLSSTGFGIVGYGDTALGGPGYSGTLASGNVTSIGATTLPAGNSVTRALKITGNLAFTNATDILNIESGGLSAPSSNNVGAVANSGQLTAGGTASSDTVDLYAYNVGTLNSKVIDNPNGAKVRLIIANINNVTTITGNNTYSGGTIFMDGREGQFGVALGGTGTIIPAGGLTLCGDLNGGIRGLTTTAAGQIEQTNDVTIFGTPFLVMAAGTTNTLSSLIFQDGGGANGGNVGPYVDTATNLILTKTTANGSVINSTNDNLCVIPIIQGTNLTVPDGATITTSGAHPTDLIIAAQLATSGSTTPLHKDGAGAVVFTFANTFTNGMNLDAGSIIFTANSAGGGTGGTAPTTSQIGTGPLTLADGTAIMSSNNFTIGNVVNVADDAGFTFGTLDTTNARANATNNLTLTNTVTLGSGAHTINVNGLNMTGTISGQLTGGTNLTKDGPGTLVLNNAGNDFGGSVTINGGTLRHNVAGSIPTGRIMTVAAGAAFNMNGIGQSIDSLNGAGSVINPGGAALLTINGSTDGTFSGVLAATTAANLALTKSGTNTQTLSGANTYGGATAITAGTLLVNGTHTGGDNYTVSGTLGGTGTITLASGKTVTVQSGGTLAPGASVGTLTINNDMTWAGLGAYLWEIDNTSGTPGADWDLLKLNGTLNITADATDKFLIKVAS